MGSPAEAAGLFFACIAGHPREGSPLLNMQ